MRFLYCLVAGNGRDGYSVVARDLLEQLVEDGHEVDTAVLVDRELDPTSADLDGRIRSLSRRSVSYRHPLLRGPLPHWLHRIRARLTARRAGDHHFCPPGFLGRVRRLLEGTTYDAAITAMAIFSRVARMVPCPAIVDLHELFTHKAKSLARLGVTGCISPYRGLSEEIEALRPFDRLWCPSRESRRIIERVLPGARCFDRHLSSRALVPAGYVPPPPRPEGPGRLLFVGSTAPENRPGLFLFLREILPRIRVALPSCEFHVVGWREADLPADLDRRNVAFHGVLRTRGEILDLFGSTDVVVIPRFLGGLTVKGVEALCLGKATVGHPAAFSGCYEIENWRHAAIAGNSVEFADAAIRLLRDPGLRRSISEAALAFSRWRFSPAGAYGDLYREIEDLRRERGIVPARRRGAPVATGGRRP